MANLGLSYNRPKSNAATSGFRECSNCRFGTGALHFYCSESGRDVDADDYCSMWQHN